MKQNKSKVIKVKGNEDWSKLVGKQISTDWSSEPQLVRENGTLEKKLLALSRDGYGFTERGCLVAYCLNGRFKQLFTSFSPGAIYPKDIDDAFKRLHKKIGQKWDNVITPKFIHTHEKDNSSEFDPLSPIDIEMADKLAERLYPKGIKNIIMSVASESGYSFRYSPSHSEFNSKYKKTKVK